MHKGFNIVLPDETAIAGEVAKMGNIYYLYSWLSKNYVFQVFDPDGMLKNVMIPMDEFKFPAFSAFVNSVSGRFKLISESRPFNWEFFTGLSRKIFYLDADRKVICEKPFPYVLIRVWLKHLLEFVPLAVEAGFIAKKGGNAIKEQRAVIYGPTEENNTMISPGVPELGFDWFMIRV